MTAANFVRAMENPESPRWIVPPPRGELPPATAPSFSVVIPAYQAAQTIGRAVASALAQTYPAHEIIVVDDGSTDDLSSALADHGGRVTLIRKENGGGASALNTGAAAASGDFVAILDADDEWAPGRLRALCALLSQRPDLDLVTTDTELVLDGRVVGRFHDATPFVAENQREEILRRCFTGGWPAVRLSRVAAIGGFDEELPIGYDWDFCIRAILDGALAGFVDEPQLRYTLTMSSLSADREAALWARVRVLEKTAHNPSLKPTEQRLLHRSLRDHRARAVLAEAASRTRGGRRCSRWLAARAATRGITRGARLALMRAAVGPAAPESYLPPEPGALAERFARDGEAAATEL